MNHDHNPVPNEHCPLTPRQREVSGILMLALAVFIIISLYVQTAGWVGYQLQNYFRLAFGDTAVIFGLLLAYFSVKVFRGSLWPIQWRQIIGLVLLVATCITIYHLSFYRQYQLPPSLTEELEIAVRGNGAGALGAVFMVGVLTAFGLPGTYVMLAAALLVSIILVFEISFIGLAKGLARLVLLGFRGAFVAMLTAIAKKRQEAQERKDQRRMAKLERAQKEQMASATEPISASIPASPDEQPATRAKRKKKQPSSEEASDDYEEVLTLEMQPTDAHPYNLPPTYMLKKGVAKLRQSGEDVQKKLLEDTFTSFGISAKVVNVCQGPVVTRYELQPAPGVKVSRITSLADDLALSLAAADVRIEAPVPGKPVVGIEVPNRETEPVLLRDVLEHSDFAQHPSKVALAIGKDIAGNPVIADLKKWLHLLIAGATGSGKSVCLNTIISSILFKATPEDVKLLMIDPKRVELAVFDGVPHLISPVVTDPKKAATALRWAVAEMERRYKLFADTGVRNIDAYAELPEEDEETGEKREHLPYIVIIVDELADLMMVAAAEVEDAICRIAQMARAAGMYLVIATQRPSVDVITGLIKANVPSRISFAVSSQVDSRTILDMSGAERLIGKGDMLFYPIGASKPTRAQGAWISDREVEALVKFWKRQAEPDYQEEVTKEVSGIGQSEDSDDELLEDAIRLVVDTGQASISMLQRRFRIGYSRAARLIDMMEIRGIVGSYQGSKPREVLVDSSIFSER